MQKIILLVLILSNCFLAKAYELGIAHKPKTQRSFSVKMDSVKKEHSPHKAAILSAVLPGAGQIYNKKYWKAGVLYAGMGVATYFLITNKSELKKYKSDISALTDTFPSTLPTNFIGVNLETLKGRRDVVKKNRDYSIIAIAALYLINIADATVDAHLFEFNVDKRISGRIEPKFGLGGYKGACLTLNF